MNKSYFISGHRDITPEEFEEHYSKRLEEIVRNEPEADFCVGDYHGVDIMAQKKLLELGIEPKHVYLCYVGEEPMNCASDKFTNYSGFADDEDRDSYMTSISDEDIAWVREGKEDSGTALNLKRRERENKSIAYGEIYRKCRLAMCHYADRYHQVTFNETPTVPLVDFTFSEALYFLKDGRKVARKGWNGWENKHLQLGGTAEYPEILELHLKTDKKYSYCPAQVDMFANDWMIVD